MNPTNRQTDVSGVGKFIVIVDTAVASAAVIASDNTKDIKEEKAHENQNAIIDKNIFISSTSSTPIERVTDNNEAKITRDKEDDDDEEEEIIDNEDDDEDYDDCDFGNNYNKNKICNCERSNETIRVKCLARALYAFFKKRRSLHRYSRKEVESAIRVIDIHFEDIYINNIQNITNRAAESIILLRFLDTFSENHPKFAAETRFVEFVKCADLFKEL